MILLQADMLELRANPDRRADGYVIEAQLELGRGPPPPCSSGRHAQGGRRRALSASISAACAA
jgi:hypothetical protein